MRRIVTGHNKEGKSVIMSDGPPPKSIGEEVGGLFELWNTDSNSVNSQDSIDRADTDILLSPPKSGTKFRYFQINPLPDGIPNDVMNQIAHDNFQQVGAANARVDTTRHPAMHKTETIDYIILLKGEVTLLLDEDDAKVLWWQQESLKLQHLNVQRPCRFHGCGGQPWVEQVSK